MYIFGFGSLINLQSIQKSFERRLTQEDLIPIKVRGYKRIWNAISKIKFNDKCVNGVFLNIQKDTSSEIWGICVKISQKEFEALKIREKNYAQITIKNDEILSHKLDEPLVAFITKDENFIAKKGDKICFIATRYIDILNQALLNYNDEFRENFGEILQDLPFEQIAGDYTFADSLQNKMAKGK